MKKKYNQVYGKWSLGTGYWLKKNLYKTPKQNIFIDPIIETYKSQVLQDIYRINLVNKISSFSIMDVGTGRQALAFEKLGCKKIDLYDISKNSFRRFKNYRKINKTYIKNYNYDIGSKSFAKLKKKYDFIYLHGVVQHTKDPATVLLNLKKK